MLDKKEHIRNYIKSRVGAPIVEMCDTESMAIDEAFETASVDYWIHLPYVKKAHHFLTTNFGELSIDIQSQLNSQIPEALRDHAYFVGITREDIVNNLVPNSANSQYFDRMLLGSNINFSNENFLISDPRYEADRQQYLNSSEAMYFGETDIYVDNVTNKVIVTYPPVEGQLHLWWAYGFSAEKTIALLPMNHLKLFRKMVALEFIEIVLASRTPIQLSGDFSIDVTDLQNKRGRLRDDLDKEIPETVNFVAQWG